MNRRAQDGWKAQLLGPAWEDRLNRWATATAKRAFFPIAEHDVARVGYGPWFAKFAVSVSWRVLTGFSLKGAFARWPPPLRASAEAALQNWREFLLDGRANPGRSEQHVVRVGLVESTSLRNLPPNLNRYLARIVDQDVAHSERDAVVYSKMGPLVILGVIEGSVAGGRETRVRMREGALGGDRVPVDPAIFDYMCDRARRLHDLMGASLIASGRRSTRRSVRTSSGRAQASRWTR